MTSDSPVLVVDLDGTLLRSDMLYESFWAALSRRWRTPFSALSAFASGRAALKRRLAALAPLDPALLPFDDAVLDYVRRWRSAGGRTALVTASDQCSADAVAAHLGLFDEVHGSDGRRNLKGEAKARLLVDRFGERGFDYLGDSRADIPVWARARRAITVNAAPGLRNAVEALAGPAEHLGAGRPPAATAYVRALRPHQWVKNALVFVPMLAAHRFTPDAFLQSTLAFVAFCLIASGLYIVNDLLDLAADRAHPRKRFRPFASGALPIAHGTLIAPGLLVAGFACAAGLGPMSVLVMLCYLAGSLAYSLDLKRRAIVDVCVLAALYTARITAGGVATGTPLSVWLLAFSIFLFFSLGAMKRHAELVDGASTGRLSLEGRNYGVADLPLMGMMTIASGYVSVLVLALYLNSPAVSTLYTSPSALWGICLVMLYWISRMALASHRGTMHDDPVVFAIKDRVSLVCLALIAAFAVGGAVL
jgi:4-hydroxybenzoate polyprenyltransferase/phosphoserine phosphatase